MILGLWVDPLRVDAIPIIQVVRMLELKRNVEYVIRHLIHVLGT